MAKATTGRARHPHDSSRPSPRAIQKAVSAGDVEAVKKALTVRQRRFAEEYAIDFNGSAAVIRAGYSGNYADRQAHILLKHEGVSFYIDHLTKTKANKIVSVNPDYVVSRITAIVNDEASKNGDKLRGLELLARHLGMFTEKSEVSVTDMNKAAEIEASQEFVALLRQMQERESLPGFLTDSGSDEDEVEAYIL